MTPRSHTSNHSSLWALITSALWFFMLVHAKENKRQTGVGAITSASNFSYPTLSYATQAGKYYLSGNDEKMLSPGSEAFLLFKQLLDSNLNRIGSTVKDAEPMESHVVPLTPMAAKNCKNQHLVVFPRKATYNGAADIYVASYSTTDASLISTVEVTDIRNGYPIPNRQLPFDCGIPNYCALLVYVSSATSGESVQLIFLINPDFRNEATAEVTSDSLQGDLACTSTTCYIVTESPNTNNLCITSATPTKLTNLQNPFCFGTNRIVPRIAIGPAGEIFVVSINKSDNSISLFKLSPNADAILIADKKVSSTRSAVCSNPLIAISGTSLVISWDEKNGVYRNYFRVLNLNATSLDNNMERNFNPQTSTVDPQTAMIPIANQQILAAYRTTLNNLEYRAIDILLPTTTLSTTSPRVVTNTTIQSTASNQSQKPLTLPANQNQTATTLASSNSKATNSDATSSENSQTSFEETLGSRVVIQTQDNTVLILALATPAALICAALIAFAAVCVKRRKQSSAEPSDVNTHSNFFLPLRRSVSIGGYLHAPEAPQAKASNIYDVVSAVDAGRYDKVQVKKPNTYENPDMPLNPPESDRYVSLPITQPQAVSATAILYSPAPQNNRSYSNLPAVAAQNSYVVAPEPSAPQYA